MIHSPIRKLVFACLAAGLVGAGWWAARVSIETPSDPLVVRSPVTYTVPVGTVERSLSFVAVAEWPLVDLARAGDGGIVTAIYIGSGDEISPGDVVLDVELRPVTVAHGEVPSFRDLSMTIEGPDVAQLQRLLNTLGFYDGDIDGDFGPRTRSAVRAWQDALGVADDGIVRRGDVVYVPDLPARVVLTESVEIGAQLSGGDVVMQRVAGDPEFTIPLAIEQRGLVPLSAAVTVIADEREWYGHIAEAREDATSDQLTLVLAGVDGGPLCGSGCDSSVPLSDRTNYAVKVELVPQTTGPVVPIAAIHTTADGVSAVHDIGGGTIAISIVAAADGLAVVEGLSAGDVIVLPTSEESG